MPSSTASASSLATLALLLFTSTTAAQLVGCDAVGCPVNDYRTAQCSVGNATLKALGIANVTTALDAQPLTWTLGLQELKTPDANVTLDRNFYLGIPPSVQLNNTVGCALIFDGVAANLSATKGDDEKFTCSRALADSCITDLISQAQTNYGDAGKDGKGGADFCNKLRDSLVDQPPKTCNGLQGSWGAISARPLTGSPAPQPVDQTQCHPTTGKDYNMFLVQSSRQENIGRDSSQLSPIIDRVTPVMTVFAKDNKADVQLTCLRLVESKAGQTVDSPTQKGAAAGLNSPPAVLLSALLAVGYFLVL